MMVSSRESSIWNPASVRNRRASSGASPLKYIGTPSQYGSIVPRQRRPPAKRTHWLWEGKILYGPMAPLSWVVRSGRRGRGVLDSSARRRIKALVRQHGLDLSAVSFDLTLGANGDDALEQAMDDNRAAIDVAADLALDTVPARLASMAAGRVEDWPAIGPRLAEHARTRGVVLTIKAHAHTAIDYPHKLIWLAEQIDQPSFRFTFDYSHFEAKGLSMELAMAPLLALSAHAGCKSTRGRWPSQEYRLPGEGDSQFGPQLELMIRLGYRGWLTPEISAMVQRRPEYDPYAAVRLAHQTLTEALAQRPAALPRPEDERHRRPRRTDPARRVPRPRAHPQRAAPGDRAGGMRGVLQHRAPPPQLGAGATAPRLPQSRTLRRYHLAAGAGGTAPRLLPRRQRRMEFLRPTGGKNGQLQHAEFSLSLTRSASWP
jgi:sugar phosphate isomerase/epimerase